MNHYLIKLCIILSCGIQLLAVNHNTDDIEIVPNPYEVMEIQRNATADQVRRAYRQLSLQTHPDRAARNNLTIEEATRRFRRITAANDILKSQRLKAEFDRHGYILKATQALERKREPDEELSHMDWLKHQFEYGLKQGATTLPFILMYRGVANLLKKWLGFDSRSERNRKKLIKKIVNYQYFDADQKEIKELQDELKEMLSKVMATQKSLINDELDEKQREKLSDRLKKYMENCQDLKQDLNEIRDDSQEDFKAFIKKINK